MNKYYFRNIESEYCHELNYFMEQMSSGEIIVLYKANRMVGHDCFFCGAIGDITMKGEETCGKNCYNYIPRNKKNGICKFWRYCYCHGEKITFTKK